MQSNRGKIPVNPMEDTSSQGIAMDRNDFKKIDFITTAEKETAIRAHRDEGYTFHILEKGQVTIEIDFKTYKVTAPAIVFLHPDQVHCMHDIDDISVSSMSIQSECLNRTYLNILQDLTPTAPLPLTIETFEIISEHFSLSLKLYRNKQNRLYHLLVKDSCNALTALLINAFLSHKKAEDSYSRFDSVAMSFRKLLEEKYAVLKRPSEYATLMHISVPYLNECIKKATGLSVSQLIRDRVILEAKRLLYHTDKSVKEIAFHLGYTDYPYFSRLFSKATGYTAMGFRNKNID